jgi:hypothetical protein
MKIDLTKSEIKALQRAIISARSGFKWATIKKLELGFMSAARSTQRLIPILDKISGKLIDALERKG